MSPALMAYGALAIAIVCEVLGTTFLMKSEQFTRLVPTLFVLLFYIVSFFFLSQSFRVIPLGLAYALWASLGIVLIALISIVIFKQTIDLPAIIGIAMIIIGVAIINLFFKSVIH